MKYQTSFEALFGVLAAQKKADFLMAPKQTKVEEGKMTFSLPNNEANVFPILDTGHEAISRVTGIPMRYYRRMQESEPELLDQNINTWFAADGERKMIRVLDGGMRAILSDRYQRIDNIDIAQSALAVFDKLPNKSGLEFIDCGLSPNYMRIKVLFPLSLDVAVGDTVKAGIVISNSEIGKGAAKVEGFTYRLVCSNGMLAATRKRKYHIGQRYEDNALLSDNTRRMGDMTTIAELHDTIRGMLTDPTWFQNEVDLMRNAKKEPVVRAIEELPQRMNSLLAFSDDEISKMLVGIGQQMSTVSEETPTRYDVANAVTWTAQRVADYDRRIELEDFGGQILRNKGIWRKIQ